MDFLDNDSINCFILSGEVMAESNWNEEIVLASMRNKMRARMILAVEFVVGAAVLNCPVDTGNLRSSINGKVIDETLGRVGTNVEYAPYVEFGTGEKAEDGKGKSGFTGQKPQPFLRPAIMDNKDSILRILDFTR